MARNHNSFAERSLGWIPDVPDQRDFVYAAPAPFQKNLPAKVNLTSKCPSVYDQGQINSCTGNAIAGAIQFDQMKQGIKSFTPSRLFIYYNERVMENTVNSDPGAQIRNGIKSVATDGAPPEGLWSYSSPVQAKPTPAAFAAAKQDLVTLYQRLVQDLNTMRGCLASGFPFVFGFTVYSSFRSQQVATTGIVPMPASGEKVVGGHAVVAVGYDDSSREFIVRNSWGTDWGIKGYFRIPYAYLTASSLADDFWTIRSVEAGAAGAKARSAAKASKPARR